MGATALMMAAGAPAAVAADDAPLIDRTDFKTSTGIFDIDALMALGRVSSPQVSPDKKKVLYGVSYESVQQNRSNNDLYVSDIDGKNRGPLD